MSTYLIVSSENRLQNKSTDALLDNLVKFLPHQYGFEKRLFVNNYKTLVLFLANPTYFYESSDQIYYSENPENPVQCIFMSGYCWLNKTLSANKPLTASDIHCLLSENNLTMVDLRKQLSGEYSIICIDNHGSITAINDWTSVEHIYYYQSAQHTSISSRPTAISYFEGKLPIDLTGMLWLPLIGFRIGEGSVYQGVKRLSQGSHLKLCGNDVQELESAFPFNPVKETPPDENELNKVLCDSIHICSENLKTVFAKENKIQLPITGGKDSRLVLAIAIQAGLKDRLELYTIGDQDHPDVIVARRIALALNIPHQIIPQSRFKDPTLGSDELLYKLAIHVFQTDGMLDAWDIKANMKAGQGFALTGFMGEVLKGYIKVQSENEIYRLSPLEIVSRKDLFDPLAIFKRHSKTQLEKELSIRFDRMCEAAHHDKSQLPDLFYLKERIPNWLGSARRIDSESIQGVIPLNIKPLIELAFRLQAEERSIELLHYKIIEKTCPKLLEIPFAFQVWNKKLIKYGADKSMFLPPVMPGRPLPARGSWQHTFNCNPGLRNKILEIFEAFPNSPVWEHIDAKQIKHLLRFHMFSVKEMVSLLGLLVVFFKVHSIEIPRKIQAAAMPGFTDDDRITIVERETGQAFAYDQNRLKLIQQLSPPLRPPSSSDSFPCSRIATRLISADYNLPLNSLQQDNAVSAKGLLEGFNGREITGWAWCPDYPMMRLRIDIFYQGKLLERIVAEQYRKTLKQAGYGDGRHGFGFKPQAVSNFEWQKITAKVVGTGFTLPVANNCAKLVQPRKNTLLTFLSASLEAPVHGIFGWWDNYLKRWYKNLFPETFQYRVFDILHHSKITPVLKAFRSSLRRIIK